MKLIREERAIVENEILLEGSVNEDLRFAMTLWGLMIIYVEDFLSGIRRKFAIAKTVTREKILTRKPKKDYGYLRNLIEDPVRYMLVEGLIMDEIFIDQLHAEDELNENMLFCAIENITNNPNDVLEINEDHEEAFLALDMSGAVNNLYEKREVFRSLFKCFIARFMLRGNVEKPRENVYNQDVANAEKGRAIPNVNEQEEELLKTMMQKRESLRNDLMNRKLTKVAENFEKFD
jgi:hypothetical protein